MAIPVQLYFFFAQNLRSDIEDKLHQALVQMESEIKKVHEIGGLPHFYTQEEEVRKHYKFDKAVPSNIFVSHNLFLEKPTRQSGKNKRAMHKIQTQNIHLLHKKPLIIIKGNLTNGTKSVFPLL